MTIAVCVTAGAGAASGQDWKSQLSKPASTVHQDVDVKVAMRDGVKLSTDLYLPEGPAGTRYPAILLRTPYDNNAEANVKDGLYFAMRGYAVVVQDTRGRYDSEGEWFPARNEARDGYDTIEWIARQAWSDGKVGMVGSSYLGIVQLLAATETPPHLTCIFPRVAYSDQYKQWTYTGGAFAFGLNLLWGGLSNSTRTRQSQYVDLFTPGSPRAPDRHAEGTVLASACHRGRRRHGMGSGSLPRVAEASGIRRLVAADQHRGQVRPDRRACLPG